MTRRFRKPWSDNAFTQGKQRKGQVCSRRWGSFLLGSPTDLVGNKKGPFLAVPGECNAQFLVVRALETPRPRLMSLQL